jgi:WD40 repeat protein
MSSPSPLPDDPDHEPLAPADEAALDELFECAVERLARGEELPLAAWLVGREALEERARAVLELAASVAVATPPRLPPVGPPALPGYELLGEVGRGAMGIVYRAREEQLQRIVALKLLAPSLSASPRSRERFLAEARALARVEHPHVVAIHAVFAEQELCAYAMEWIEGSTLAAAIAARDPRLDAACVARIGCAIAEALEAVHGKGLVHRDVKPSNILLRADLRPVLSDFGLVRDAEQSLHTANGEFLGTAAYAAPEQLRGEHALVDAQSDVYSLGVTLYTALAGTTPFGNASSTAEFLRRIEGGDALPLRRAAPRVARDLATIVMTAMERDRERRYASARALADDLTRYLRCEPIAARRAGWWIRTRRWIERSPRLAAALLALFLSLAGGLVLALLLLTRAEAERERAETERERAEQRTYTAHLSAAEGALRASDFIDARAHLGSAPERHRHWEWRYLASKLDPSRVIGHHERAVNALAVHPEGALVATCDDTGRVCVIDIASGEPRFEHRHRHAAEDLAWSPDGAWLATGVDKTLELRDGASFALRARFATGARVRGLDFDTEGAELTVALATGELLMLELGALLAASPAGHPADALTSIELPSPRKRWDGHAGAPHRIDRGPRELLASTTSTGWKLWDARRGKRVEHHRVEGNHFGIAIDPLGELAVLGSNDGPLRLFALAERGGEPTLLEGHRGRVMDVAWSADGTQIASASYDRTIRLWSRDGAPKAILTGHTDNVQCVAFLPNGAGLVSAAGTSSDGSVRFWPRLSVEPQRLRVPDGHRSVALTLAPERRWYALHSFTGERLKLLSGMRGSGAVDECLLDLQATVLEIDTSRDGRWLAVASRDGAALFDTAAPGAATRALVRMGLPLTPLRRFAASTSQARGLCFGAGDDLLVGHLDGTVALWDHQRGELLRSFRLAGGHVHDVALDPAGRRIAALTRKQLAVWDRASFAPLLERLALEHANAIALDASGRFLALAVGSSDPRIEIHDLDRGTLRATWLGATREITALAFSPDGQRLAVAGEDRLLRLYDPATGMLALSLRDHGYQIKSVDWSADGRALASSSRDGCLLFRETELADPRAR